MQPAKPWHGRVGRSGAGTVATSPPRFPASAPIASNGYRSAGVSRLSRSSRSSVSSRWARSCSPRHHRERLRSGLARFRRARAHLRPRRAHLPRRRRARRRRLRARRRPRLPRRQCLRPRNRDERASPPRPRPPARPRRPAARHPHRPRSSGIRRVRAHPERFPRPRRRLKLERVGDGDEAPVARARVTLTRASPALISFVHSRAGIRGSCNVA